MLRKKVWGISKYFLSAALLLMFATPGLAIGKYGIGVGFVLGDPSAITMKYFINEQHAFDVGIGEAGGDGFYLYGDYLLHFPTIIPVEKITLYLGGGIGFHDFEKDRKHKDDIDENRIEVRLPIGVEFETPRIPLGVFLEIAPAMRLAPDVDFGFRGGLGIRYYF